MEEYHQILNILSEMKLLKFHKKKYHLKEVHHE